MAEQVPLIDLIRQKDWTSLLQVLSTAEDAKERVRAPFYDVGERRRESLKEDYRSGDTAQRVDIAPPCRAEKCSR